MPDQKPIWQHDCEKCRYLGTTLDENRNEHDWYVCGDSVVARYGNEGSRYWSHDVGMVKDDRYLHVVVFDDPQHYPFLNEKMIVARFMLAQKEK